MPVIEYWEDNYRNNLDRRVGEITQRAIRIAKYRKKHIASERAAQTDILRILENFMERKIDKNQEKDFAR